MEIYCYFPASFSMLIRATFTRKSKWILFFFFAFPTRFLTCFSVRSDAILTPFFAAFRCLSQTFFSIFYAPKSYPNRHLRSGFYISFGCLIFHFRNKFTLNFPSFLARNRVIRFKNFREFRRIIMRIFIHCVYNMVNL